MAFDEVRALQTIEKLDAQGDGELIEALASADDPVVNDALAKAAAENGWTPEQVKKVRAGMKVMGSELAKAFPFPNKTPAPAAAPAATPGAVAAPAAAPVAAAPAAPAPMVGKKKKKVTDGLDVGDDGMPEEGEPGYEEKSKKALAFPGAVPFKACKSDDDLPDDVRERLAKADELSVRLEKAEQTVASMVHQRERETYIKKAAEIADALPGASADDLGAILLKASKSLTTAEQAKLEAVLKQSNLLIKKSAVFAEFGSALSDGEGGDPYAQLRGEADALRKADPALTPEGARAKVLKTHPDLMAAINKAQDERVRKAR